MHNNLPKIAIFYTVHYKHVFMIVDTM